MHATIRHVQTGRPLRRVLLFACGIAGAVAAAPMSAGAQEYDPPQYELKLLQFDVVDIRTRIWELEFGLPIENMAAAGYFDPHCGTNGGPPSIRLDDWSDFAQCPPDAVTGLHEVWFTEDDEVEYIARSFRQQTFDPGPASANVLFNHKVIYSVLVDGDGIIQGYRVFTDSRESPDVRLGAYFVATPLKNVYGFQAFDCVDRPPEEGEAPMDGQYVNQLCTAVVDGQHIEIESRLLRKPGQTAYDPIGRETIGYFESTARLEVINAAIAAE